MFSLDSLPNLHTRQALLILNLQNDFLAADGKLPVPLPADYAARIQTVVPVVRRSGDVIWVRTEFEDERIVNDAHGEGASIVVADHPTDDDDDDDHHSTMSRSIDEAFLSVVRRTDADASCCTADTVGAAFAPWVTDLIDHNTDQTLVTSYYSAFGCPDLLPRLRGGLVTELYIAGLLSNVSVYATALDAVRHGYTVTLVEDVLAYRRPLRHADAMRQMVNFMGADVTTSLELVRALARPDRVGAPLAAPATIAGGPAERAVLEAFAHPFLPSPKPLESQSIDSAIALIDRGPDGTSTSSSSSSSSSPPSPPPPPSVLPVVSVDPSTDPAASTWPPLPPSSPRSQPEPAQEDDVDGTPDRPSVEVPSSHDPGPVDGRDGSSSGTSQDAPTAKSPSPSSSSSAAAVTVEQTSDPTLLSSTVLTSSSVATSIAAVTVVEEASRPSRPAATPSSTPPQRLPVPDLGGRPRSTVSSSSSATPMLGPADVIGESDSYIVHDLIPPSSRADVFERLRDQVRFRAMYHRGGEVPRLVAVQGETAEEDGSVPVYRHPADESPPLQPFAPVVQEIREAVQKALKHPVNHVLVQLYRDGQDYISEHSDKTLDIVRGSTIANVSVGARRTMILRTKRSDLTTERARRTQRIPLPSGSMFVLGLATNARWLHGIRADRRPTSERSLEERSHGATRISLTFRHIGTFVRPRSQRIWGQGARSKRADAPHPVAAGGSAEAERMIVAFGRENQESDFDWEGVYGTGFDAVDLLPRRPRLHLARHVLSNRQVQLYMAEVGMVDYDVRQPDLSSRARSWTSGRVEEGKKDDDDDDDDNLDDRRLIRLVDDDDDRSETVGALPVMIYVEKYRRDDGGTGGLFGSSHTRSEVATILNRLGQSHQLIRGWERFCQVTTLPRPGSSSSSRSSASSSAPSSSNVDRLAVEKALHGELAVWEERASRSDFIGGKVFSVADAAFWPVLHEIVWRWADWDVHIFPCLGRYHDRIGARPSARRFSDWWS